jgi:trigger factor
MSTETQAESLVGESGNGGGEASKRLNITHKVDHRSACERHVTVVVPREDIDRYIKAAFDDLRGKAEIPGFRPGRAPRKLVESRFKERVSDQVKSELLMDSMGQLSDDQVFTAIGEPDFDVASLTLPETGPFTFEFNIEVRPEFNLPKWQGLKLKKLVANFSESDVSTHMSRLLSRFGTRVTTSNPAEVEDTLEANLVAKVDGQVIASKSEVSIVIRKRLSFEDAVVENFDQIAVGATEGAVLSAKTTISSQAENEALRGKEVEITIEVLEVTRILPPDLTPSFLQSIGGFKSEEELRTAVRAEMERQFRFHQQRSLRQQVTALLTAGANWALPPTLLRRQARREFERLRMELQSSGFSSEDISAHLHQLTHNSLEKTESALKEHFILERIAEEHKIEAEPADYDNEIELIADQGGESPRRVRARMEKRGLMDTLRNQIIERKAIDLITEAAEFTETDYELPAKTTHALNLCLSEARGESIPEAKYAAESESLPKSEPRY